MLTSRRQFLVTAAATGAASLAPARRLLAASAASQVNLGVIGCGGRGKYLMRTFAGRPGVRIAAVCDADGKRAEEAAAEVPGAAVHTDLRRLLDSTEIDAVVVATCNHWHCLAAVWAMQAGKHVYVEKPLGNTQWEGRQVVNAAQRYGRVCQIGTQQRSDPMQAEIKQFLHEDKAIGEIQSVRVNRFGARGPIGRRETPLTPPQTCDYNLWLGPAEDVPLYRNKLHYDWHWVWNTGSGEMGNWGVHILDDVRNNVFLDRIATPGKIAAAGVRAEWQDAGDTPNVHLALSDAAGVPVAFTLNNLVGAEGHPALVGPRSGYVVYGEHGRFEGQRGRGKAFDADGALVREFHGNNGDTLHQQNFIDAVRAEDASLLNAPIEIGHDSTAWCNLINTATRVAGLPTPPSEGEPVVDGSTRFGPHTADALREQMQELAGAPLALNTTLHYDSDGERFTGPTAAAANPFLKRNDRSGFVVPEIDAV